MAISELFSEGRASESLVTARATGNNYLSHGWFCSVICHMYCPHHIGMQNYNAVVIVSLIRSLSKKSTALKTGQLRLP